MKPEDVRMARAALNWSLEQLAHESGVHRNTISNFKTGKYAGDPATVATIKRTLEAFGVIFPDEKGENSTVTLRRFQVGDVVRFRAQSRVPSDYDIAKDELGTVVWVEPHHPETGPTYTPAMAAKVTSKLWEMTDMVKVLEDWEAVRPR